MLRMCKLQCTGACVKLLLCTCTWKHLHNAGILQGPGRLGTYCTREGSTQPVWPVLVMQQIAFPGLGLTTPTVASRLTVAVLWRRCCRNATNYFGQDCYNNPNSDRGVDYYHYHAALGGWNTSTLNAGPLSHPLLSCTAAASKCM